MEFSSFSRAILTSLLFCACSRTPVAPIESLAPKPLPTLEGRDALHQVELAPPFGERSSSGAFELILGATAARAGPDSFALDSASELARLRLALGADAKVLLRAEANVYLAQVAPLLALLDDAAVPVSLAHPTADLVLPVKLRDEASFRVWLGEAKPGKIRVIQRADGLELQTNVGKLGAADKNGPSVPLRGGELDIATLRRGLGQLKERFADAPDVCFVPSFGTELVKVALAVSGDYESPGEPIFAQAYLVYPRPGAISTP